MSISIPVSIGELLDKYSILLIKYENIQDLDKKTHITLEINYLEEYTESYLSRDKRLFNELKSINEELWDIEDKIRIKELNKSFDIEFIELARLVYFTNDKRAEIKNAINKTYNSNICEVKEYANYNN